MVDTRTLHAKEALEILEENFGDRVFGARIKKTVRFAEAPVKGMSVLKYDPNGHGGRRRIAGWRRRCSRMGSGKRASMREGPLAALFRKTETEGLEPARRADRRAARELAEEPPERATPTPQERLRNAFSSDMPGDMMAPPRAHPQPPPPSASTTSGARRATPASASRSCAWSASAAAASTPSTA